MRRERRVRGGREYRRAAGDGGRLRVRAVPQQRREADAGVPRADGRGVGRADDGRAEDPVSRRPADCISTHAGGFDWTLGLFRDTYAGKPDGPATQRRRENLDTASFCCALVPLAAFRDAGMLDERFFMYYEETDFIRRAQAKGYRVRYEPSAVVYHRESGASGGGWMTPFKQYYATRNRPYLVRKHATSRAAYAWFTAYFLATRVASAARHGRAARLAHAAGDAARHARLLPGAHGPHVRGARPVRPR